ncbi:MAG: GerMN domain-containing protein [Pseudomonadota bacterium]
MSKPKAGKRNPEKGKGKKKRKPRSNFFLILTIALLTFLAGSFVYYKYHEKIYPVLPSKVKEKTTVSLFFADPTSESLLREKREIQATKGLSNQAKQVILELIKGPATNLTRTIPHGTTLRDLSFSANHIAYVDFSSELIDRHPGGSSAELLTIYSIVNSLTLNFEDIEKVQILVEGNRVKTIAGHIFASRPFEANMAIIGK